MSADFTETPQARKRLAAERRTKVLFGLMAASMVIPLLIIVSYLIAQAWPVLVAWNETNALPPWGQAELRHKLESVYGK